MTHSELVNACLLELSGRGVMCWKNQTGVARAMDNPQRIIKFGLKGSADILGVMPGGRAIAVECKTGTGRQHGKQPQFQKAFETRGGLYVLARSIDDLPEIAP